MVRICSYNARGLGDFAKRKQVFTLLKHKKIDIALIQETHATDTEINLWRSQWGGKVMYANGTSASKGVLILASRDSDVTVDRQVCDVNGRYLLAEITINSFVFVICNIYAPNQDSPNFFLEVASHVEGI